MQHLHEDTVRYPLRTSLDYIKALKNITHKLFLQKIIQHTCI